MSNWPKWTLFAVTGALLAGLATFLAFQPLTEADQYSSIGAFLLAVVSLAYAVREKQQPATKETEPVLAENMKHVVAENNRYVQSGDDSTFTSQDPVEPPPSISGLGEAQAKIHLRNNGVVQTGDRNILRIGPAPDNPVSG